MDVPLTVDVLFRTAVRSRVRGGVFYHSMNAKRLESEDLNYPIIFELQLMFFQNWKTARFLQPKLCVVSKPLFACRIMWINITLASGGAIVRTKWLKLPTQDLPKFSASCAVSKQGKAFGSFLLADSTVTGVVRLDMLKELLISVLEEDFIATLCSTKTEGAGTSWMECFHGIG
jgi:hypothetical protein